MDAKLLLLRKCLVYALMLKNGSSSFWLKTNWLPFWLNCFLLSTNKHQGWTEPASIKRVCLSNLLSHLAAVNTKWPCRRDTHYRHVKWFSAVRFSLVKQYLSLFQLFIQDWCRWGDTSSPEVERAPFPLVTRLCLGSGCTGHSSGTPVQSLPGRRRQRGREKKGGRVGSAHKL